MKLNWSCCGCGVWRLLNGSRGEDTDIAVVPISAVATKAVVVFQVAVIHSLSAEVADGHTTAEMEEGGIKAIGSPRAGSRRKIRRGRWPLAHEARVIISNLPP